MFINIRHLDLINLHKTSLKVTFYRLKATLFKNNSKKLIKNIFYHKKILNCINNRGLVYLIIKKVLAFLFFIKIN